MLKNQGAGALAGVKENMRKSGDISAFIGANASISDKVGQGLGKSYLDQEVTNVGIGNRQEELNNAIARSELIANQKAKAASSLLINEGLHGIGSNIAGGLKDSRQSNQVDKNNTANINSLNEMFKNFNFNEGSGKWSFS